MIKFIDQERETFRMNPVQLAKNIFTILVIRGICIERYLPFKMRESGSTVYF